MRFEFNHNPGQMEGLHVLAGFGLAAILLARFFPFNSLPFTLCHFRAITGLPCPTCGMTTAFIHVVHGRFLEAWLTSPLGVGVFAGVVAAIAFVAGHHLWKWPAVRIRLSRGEKAAATIGLIAVVLANWAYNILHLTLHKF